MNFENHIELKRAPGTCCPEPSCDYGDCDVCESCGAACLECSLKKKIIGDLDQ